MKSTHQQGRVVNPLRDLVISLDLPVLQLRELMAGPGSSSSQALVGVGTQQQLYLMAWLVANSYYTLLAFGYLLVGYCHYNITAY
jgi:hypothetical protein